METVFKEVDVWKCLEKETSKVKKKNTMSNFR